MTRDGYNSNRTMRTERGYTKERKTRTCTEKAPESGIRAWQEDKQAGAGLGRWHDGASDDYGGRSDGEKEKFGNKPPSPPAPPLVAAKIPGPIQPETAPNRHVEIAAAPKQDEEDPMPLSGSSPPDEMEKSVLAAMEQFNFGASDSDD